MSVSRLVFPAGHPSIKLSWICSKHSTPPPPHTPCTIHTSCVTDSSPLHAQPGGLRDESYGVHVDAVKLKRRVEMYQWEEERRNREFKEPDGSITTETEFSYRMLLLAVHSSCDSSHPTALAPPIPLAWLLPLS